MMARYLKIINYISGKKPKDLKHHRLDISGVKMMNDKI